MITDKDRKILRPVIGEVYTPQILKMLFAKGITNQNGDPFTSAFIRFVYLGTRENLDVELCFWDLYDDILDKREKLAKRRKTISSD